MATTEDITRFQGTEVIVDIEKEDVQEVQARLLKSSRSSYRGFASPNDAEFQSMEESLRAGMAVTLLLKNGELKARTHVAPATLTYAKSRNCVTLVDETQARLDLPIRDLVSVCRGADGSTSLRKSFRYEKDAKTTLALVFRRDPARQNDENDPVARNLKVSVSDKSNTELDVKFVSADIAEQCTRFFETLLRDASLAIIASRHVTYFPPMGEPSAVKLSKKVHHLKTAQHKLHQSSSPEASKKEIQRIQSMRLKEITEEGYPQLTDEFNEVLQQLQNGVYFTVYRYHGVADVWYKAFVGKGSVCYDKDHVIRVSEEEPQIFFCGLINGKGSTDRVYSVSELQSVALGVPIPVRTVLRHVPADMYARTVCLTFNLGEQHMTFGSEELARKVYKFFNTVCWHREQQFLENNKVFLLTLKDKTETNGRVETVEEAVEAPAG